MRQNRFFLGTWLTVIFLKSPLAMADLRGRNMFTWRPTLIFLVSAPCGNIACTCNTRESARACVTASQCCGSGSGSTWIHIFSGNLDPHPDPHPHEIKIRIRSRIRIEVISWIRNRIRIRINLQTTSQIVRNMCLFFN
jgi:hypothetical protein